MVTVVIFELRGSLENLAWRICKEKEDLAGVVTQRGPLRSALLAGLIALCREGQAENGREADYEIADD